MSKKILLLGNGINRCFEKSSWQEAIENVRARFGVELPMEQIKELPCNMQIVAASDDHVDEAMSGYCADLCADVISDENKELLLFITDGFDDVLTTNYSFELEQALGIKPTAASYRHASKQMVTGLPKSRQKTNIFKYHGAGGKRIWHIHGDAAAPNSVVMGHYYYGKLLRAIQERISEFMPAYMGRTARGLEFDSLSWVDLFLMNNVYIIGCLLDLCEYDLYYLLCCKKRRKNGSTVTYFIKQGEEISLERRIMFDAYDVNVITIDAADYKDFYRQAAERARNE